jgi:hypothetical protein
MTSPTAGSQSGLTLRYISTVQHLLGIAFPPPRSEGRATVHSTRLTSSKLLVELRSASGFWPCDAENRACQWTGNTGRRLKSHLDAAFSIAGGVRLALLAA